MTTPEQQKNTRRRLIIGGLVGFVVFYLLSMILRSFGNDLGWANTALLITSILSIASLIVGGVGVVWYLWRSRRG
ncbi:MAG: hypothetical protein IIZ13_16665 [Renibacterium sp.]|nr:hypothetical protein [Renibacterium sp.]